MDENEELRRQMIAAFEEEKQKLKEAFELERQKNEEEKQKLRESMENAKQALRDRDQALRDRDAVISSFEQEKEENARMLRDQTLSDYLTGVHRITFHMQRLVPAPRTTVPQTLSEGSKSTATTSGRTSIVGKFYPHKLRVWTDYESTCRAVFGRVAAALGDQPLFPSRNNMGVLSKDLVEDLPSEFLGSESFINEVKTSEFLHETLQKPAQRILNAYLHAINCPKKLYFDSHTVSWRPPASDVTIVAVDAEAEAGPAAAAATQSRPPPKTQPDCLILCADILTSTAQIEAAATAETGQAEHDAADRGDDVTAESATTIRHVHRISVAEHKAVHRLRAVPVSRYVHAIDEDFAVQLAHDARKASPSKARTDPQGDSTPEDASAGTIAKAQEDAARKAPRGQPGQVFFVRALIQAFHYMVSSGVEYGYMATGETLTLLRVPRDDPTTLLYHTAVFSMYTKPWLTEDGQVAVGSGTSLPAPPALASSDVDITQLGVSLLTSLCLLAFESRPEPVRQRSINLSQLTCFPDLPESVSRGSTSRQSSRKRRMDDDDDDDDDGDDDGDDDDGDDNNDNNDRGRTSRGHLQVPMIHRPRRSSPLKRTRSASSDNDDNDSHNDNDSAVGDMYSGKRHGKRRRVGRQYDNIVGPTQPSPLDPSTFRPIRPYCSQACLLSLVHDGELDSMCPNDILHRQAQRRDGTDMRTRPAQHAITVHELHELVRLQLLANAEQDCHCFLEQGLSGSIGCLFKITVTGYGYTFSAKGVEGHFSGRLRHEERIYEALATQQGHAVPVCLGVVQLLLPWPMANGKLVTHMLLMSYAGRPLYRLTVRAVQAMQGGVDLEREVERTLDELEGVGFMDTDTESNGNLTWCSERQRVMKIDFDHAFVRPRETAAAGAGAEATPMAKAMLAAGGSSSSGIGGSADFRDDSWLRVRRGRQPRDSKSSSVENLLLA